MIPVRRLPLPLLLGYAVAGCFGAAPALAQTSAPAASSGTLAPLAVDPALLGLPRVSKTLPPPAATGSKAEVRPVEAPQVSKSPAPAPVAGEESAAEAAPGPAKVAGETDKSGSANTAKSATTGKPAPAAAAAVAKPASAVPVTPVAATAVPVASAPAAPAPQPQPAPQVPQAVLPPVAEPSRRPVAASSTPLASGDNADAHAGPRGLAVLRVDPALLGQPALAARPGSGAVAASAGSATVRPVVAGAAAGIAQVAGASRSVAGEQPWPPADRPAKDQPQPTYIAANRIYGNNDTQTIAEGDVDLIKGETRLQADKLTYWPVEDETEALGNVVLSQERGVVKGPKLRMKVGDQTGTFDTPTYTLRQETKRDGVKRTTTAYGEADRIDFLGEDQIGMINATYSTCKPGNTDWYAKVEDLKLDYEREMGEGKHGTVYFKDMPILYAPNLTFSLNNQRQSGFLAPTFGSTSKSGFDLTVPYYWNIAPNRDATIAPRVFTKRGMQLNGEFRYLEPAYNGVARVEWLPTDQVRNISRHAYSYLHNQGFSPRLWGSLNINGVSDDNYYTDLSSRIGITSQTNLVRQGVLNYSGDWWNAQGQVLRYQTIQPDPANPTPVPYHLLPQFTLNARQGDLGLFDASFLGQYSNFRHATKVEGQRAVLYPQLAMPFVQPGYYVTPKVGVHMTNYALTRQAIGTPDSQNRALPIFSVDAGMTFERDTRMFGQNVVQTLEPRLYYLNVPYRDQSKVPLFDTALADFNFAQVFSENLYTGQDRIADANQLTAALVSRLIDPATGAESMRAMVGQRYYFRDQQVRLNPTDPIRTANSSDLLAALSGRIAPKMMADGAVQYDNRANQLSRMAVGVRYLADVGKTLNVSYRYTRDLLSQIDVNGQWPLGRGWYAVGRYNYSFKEGRVVETIGGLEYNGGCWVARTVMQRFAATAGAPSTALFFQLELNDFSRIGSNPLDLLKRSIQGYGKINTASPADPVFGGDY